MHRHSTHFMCIKSYKIHHLKSQEQKIIIKNKKSRTERSMCSVNLVKILNLEILIRKFLVLCGGGFTEIKRNESGRFLLLSQLSSLCAGLCSSPLVAVSIPKYTGLAEKQKN